MLPAKYTTSPGKGRPGKSPTYEPPLGITGVVCSSHMLELPKRGKLHYTIYRPRMLRPSLSSKLPVAIRILPPLVCVAGGPGLSSQYLSVLVHHITDRAVILFDALGCGQSTRLPQAKLTLDEGVNDLVALLHALFLNNDSQQKSRFHLLGHSSGGILAYEALTRNDAVRKRCASLIQSNTPYSVSEALERRKKFCETWNGEDEDDDREEDAETPAAVHFVRHECRRTPVPLLLHQSLSQVRTKTQSYDKDWETYKPQQEPQDQKAPSHPIPAALLISGQYDYVTDCDNWRSHLQCASEVQCIRLAGTSHFSMVEDEGLYGTVVSTFLKESDNES